MRLAGLLVVATIGCGSLEVDMSKVVPAPAGADQAVELITAFYGVSARPTIYWYGGAALNCGYGTGYVDQKGSCVGGDQQDDTLIVSDRGGAPLSGTSLAHELAHYASDKRGEGGDQDHCGHFFRDDGESCAEPQDDARGDTGAANRMLAAMGL